MTAIASQIRRGKIRPRAPAALLGACKAKALALDGAVAVILLGSLIYAQSPGPGAFFIPGDGKAGMHIFFEKGCARCHAVLDEGGRSAPDLARAPAAHLSAGELVAAMWNHAPAMWEKMQLERVTTPKLSESETANLFAFLYSVRSLDESGDPERGRQLLSEKRCLECHAVAGRGGRTGPDLKKWAGYRNPVSWIEAMWNHAAAMQARMAARGMGWPKFEGNDVADLIAYIRDRAPVPEKRVYLQPGNPERGRRIFQQKGCAGCHAIRGAGGGRGAAGAPDLGRPTLPRTLGQFAGLMWNHAPAMWTSMQASQVPRPEFSNEEMADLIAYLFAERYFERRASAERGQRLFEEKGCAGCHTLGRGAGLGPDLARWRGRTSPISLATALWNHGPVMLAKMREQQVPWPRFRPGEITDVMEFLGEEKTGKAQVPGKP